MSNVEKNWSHLFTLEALVKLSDIVMDNALKKNFTRFERLLPNCSFFLIHQSTTID